MTPSTIKFGTENQYDKNWTAQTIPFSKPNINSASANLSNANDLNKSVVTGEYFKTASTDAPIPFAAKSTANMVANTVVGAGKAFTKGTVGVASGLQSLGKGILGGISRVFGGSGDTSQLGLDALDPSTEKGQKVQTQLKPSNDQQNMAGYGQIAGELVPGVVEGLPALKNLAKSVFEKSTSGKVLTESERALKSTIDTVSPKLNKAETETAIAQGKGKPGGTFSKAKITPDDRTVEIAHATQGIVKPKASFIENVNGTRKALETEAESLKGQIAKVDHPYTYKELNSRLSNVEEPISIKGTQFEKQIKAVKGAAIDIAKKKGGNVSDLLDARKEFDALVQKEYPNLWDKENAPMRNAVKAIRDEMNNFIEENLPDNVSFKDSLHKQSLFYDAIDNMSEKAVEETKNSAFSRGWKAVKEHPVGAGLSVVGADKVLKETTGIGF